MSDFVTFIKGVPEGVLLKIGRRICPTDYAVRFYGNKQHSRFCGNREELERAVNRAWSIGAFNHRSEAAEILCEWAAEQGISADGIEKWIKPSPIEIRLHEAMSTHQGEEGTQQR